MKNKDRNILTPAEVRRILEDRDDDHDLEWKVETEVTLFAALHLKESDAVSWTVGGLWRASELEEAQKMHDKKNHDVVFIPVRITFPNVPCRFTPYRIAGEATIELTQSSFSIFTDDGGDA